MDITEIIVCVIALLAAVVSVFVIPCLKNILTDIQRNRIKTYIEVAVKAAEMLFPEVDGEKLGKKKLQYVADYLATKGITFNVDDVHDEIRMQIESAVQSFTN